MDKGQGGFSLLEVLVAAGALVLLLAGLNTLFIAGSQVLQSGLARSELQQHARVALLQMTQEIRKAEEITGPAPGLPGEAPELLLVYEEEGQLVTVRYRVNNEGKLIRSVKKGQKGNFSGNNPVAHFFTDISFKRQGNFIEINLVLAKDGLTLPFRGGASLRNHPIGRQSSVTSLEEVQPEILEASY